MFGFWGVFSRLGTLLGIQFGVVSDMAGGQQALLLLVVFFVVGGLMLAPLKLEPSPEAE